MGMIDNVEKIWWKTEDFSNFRFRTITIFYSTTKTKNCSELKISKVLSFPPNFFNIFNDTHKIKKKFSGKCRKFSDLYYSACEHFVTYFYLCLRARIFYDFHLNSIKIGEHVL